MIGCTECEHTGYLLGQTYDEADIPTGWTPVQRCDTCATFDDDEAAARAAAQRYRVAFMFCEPATVIIGDEMFDDGAGDWAIEWLPPVPSDWPVQPLAPAQYMHAASLATCGACGRSWDDAVVTSMTPTPAARCPFEPFH